MHPALYGTKRFPVDEVNAFRRWGLRLHPAVTNMLPRELSTRRMAGKRFDSLWGTRARERRFYGQNKTLGVGLRRESSRPVLEGNSICRRLHPLRVPIRSDPILSLGFLRPARYPGAGSREQKVLCLEAS